MVFCYSSQNGLSIFHLSLMTPLILEIILNRINPWAKISLRQVQNNVFLEVRKQMGSNDQINQKKGNYNFKYSQNEATEGLRAILLTSFLERSKFTVYSYKDQDTCTEGQKF